MRKAYFIIFCIIIFSDLYSQNLLYDVGKVSYITGISNEYYSITTKMSDYPNFITTLIDGILEKAVGKHNKNFTFKSGVILRIEEYYQEYPEYLNDSHWPRPSYVFLYNWTDTILGIKRHEISLCLDKIGQITYLNFPSYYDFNRIDFIPLDTISIIADSIVMKESESYIRNEFRLYYDQCKNNFIWIFDYTIKMDSVNTIDKSIEVPMIRKFTNEYFEYGELEDVILEEEIIPIKKRP